MRRKGNIYFEGVYYAMFLARRNFATFKNSHEHSNDKRRGLVILLHGICCVPYYNSRREGSLLVQLFG